MPEAEFGLIPLERVYGFEPIPEEPTEAQGRHVLGAQGNVWTQFIKTTDYAEYMVFPRLLGLSEVVWSPTSARNWPDFQRRLAHQFVLLDGLGVNYDPLDKGNE